MSSFPVLVGTVRCIEYAWALSARFIITRPKSVGSVITRLRWWTWLVRLLCLHYPFMFRSKVNIAGGGILTKVGWTRLSYRRVIMRHEVLHVSGMSRLSRDGISWCGRYVVALGFRPETWG